VNGRVGRFVIPEPPGPGTLHGPRRRVARLRMLVSL